MNAQRSRYLQGHFRLRTVLTSLASLGLTMGCLVSLRAASEVQAAGVGDRTKAPASEPVAEQAFPPRPSVKNAETANDQPPVRDEALWPTLKDFYPERFKQLEALREKDPHKFAQVERQMRPWLHQLREARAQNPELARLMVAATPHRDGCAGMAGPLQCRKRRTA